MRSYFATEGQAIIFRYLRLRAAFMLFDAAFALLYFLTERCRLLRHTMF